MIRLEPVGPENWRLGLSVAEHQKRYVSDSAGILARAYAYRDHRSRAFVVYDEQVPVGMVMYYDCEPLKAYDLSQMFVDQRYQGRGFGAETLTMLLEQMRREGRYNKVVLCYIEGNEAAKRLYHRFGFQITDRDGNEIIMERSL